MRYPIPFLLALYFFIALTTHASAVSNDLFDIIDRGNIRELWWAMLNASEQELNDFGDNLYPPLHTAVIRDNPQMALSLLTHPLVDRDKPDLTNVTLQQKLEDSPFLTEEMQRILRLPLESSLMMDERRVTQLLLEFRDFLSSKVQKRETFLRNDSDVITNLLGFPRESAAFAPFRELLAQIDLRETKCTFEGIENGKGKECEKGLVKLMKAILKKWQRINCDPYGPIARYLHGLCALTMQALDIEEQEGRHFVMQVVFLRFINPQLLNNSSAKK